MTSEREEKNRKLAEWLEPLSSLPSDDDSEEMKLFEPEVWIASFRLSKATGLHVPCWEPPDFFTDEAANALLLEKMPNAYLVRLTGQWECAAGDWYNSDSYVFDSDRKACIAEAAYQLALKEKP